jgi:hypothetical protein
MAAITYWSATSSPRALAPLYYAAAEVQRDPQPQPG